ncbi:hypothetical protein F5Y14DRAFT_417607 [Nemania sp. NC0429]|nr:hypothetical protein F5Y14DRAFT_417607 [Nemania sp. NC0429]
MGLPLFIPPVESDLPPKSSAKDLIDPSHARSPIRRATERRRQMHEAREHRLRMLAALQARDQSNAHRARAPLQPSSTTASSTRPLDVRRTSGRQSPRLENPRISELSQHIEQRRRYLSQAASRDLAQDLAAAEDVDDDLGISNLTQPRDDFGGGELQTSMAFRRGPVGYTPYGLPGRARWRHETQNSNEESRHHRRRVVEPTSQRMVSDPIEDFRRVQRALYVGGLGDRDRSLSPDADGVWDTLQSTLTPDPQPPSASSSFTSQYGSAPAQVNWVGSSRSWLSSAPNHDTEPPCDPIIDDSGSDSEGDVTERPTRPSGATTSHSRRSYADVVAEPRLTQSPETADASDPDREWLLGMHRIVRRLASRSDIPDDWWSQAGLSRSISWEDIQ